MKVSDPYFHILPCSIERRDLLVLLLSEFEVGLGEPAETEKVHVRRVVLEQR